MYNNFFFSSHRDKRDREKTEYRGIEENNSCMIASGHHSVERMRSERAGYEYNDQYVERVDLIQYEGGDITGKIAC